MILPILQFFQADGAGDASLKRFLSFASLRGRDAALDLLNSESDLSRNIRISADVSRNIINSRAAAEKLAAQLKERHVDVLWLGGTGFPDRLVKILGLDAPPVLFVMGNKDLFNSKSIGFCGSRNASEKGIDITAQCAEQLAQRAICVTSGYAHGVDLAAHASAMMHGGVTILVLVEGILKYREKQMVRKYMSQENHLVVSQFPPNLPWLSHNAMKRNGTIIGLSDAMILVESRLKGGTFAAGEETLKRNRPLFVINFKQPGPSAEANPYFIKHGGKAIQGNRQGQPKLEQVLEVPVTGKSESSHWTLSS